LLDLLAPGVEQVHPRRAFGRERRDLERVLLRHRRSAEEHCCEKDALHLHVSLKILSRNNLRRGRGSAWRAAWRSRWPDAARDTDPAAPPAPLSASLRTAGGPAWSRRRSAPSWS